MAEKEFMSPEAAGQSTPIQGINAPWESQVPQQGQQYRETLHGYRYTAHQPSPEDIDLSGFKTNTIKKRFTPQTTAVVTVIFMAIFAVIFGITKSSRDMKNRQTSRWQSDYTLQETSKSINDKYDIVGVKNGNDTVQFLLEQTSDDAEVHAKVTVVFYSSNNDALDIITGNATMHGKGGNAIIEVKIPSKAKGFDHMSIISEE